ncbi:hypothetical protein [Clostridium sporogenes]|uniref:Uncharacterized protein n=1 Tax=Clostridium botulinum TaxID=1491 RepID=A0AAU8YWK5_CLOBO|nr:hypothetical protein [Clostridium sporogenes]AVP64193.1 hypothetical protein C3B64_07945 [Clostridium botulinum]KOY66502.1 hypothetical protein AN649_07695 [Clostridium sporogenes]MBW5457814.1 hypothetical protein [Clostridium sporogenes]MCF4016958.1 hypothetical protein [Clostridium sporogenes]MDS1006202.1 hypothetical protein [Clostridium sporogenes]
MALGNVYLVPEQGWSRINNDNENFQYINMSKKVYSDKTNFYLGDVHFSQDLTKYSAVKFNIVGSQFRLLNQIYTGEGRNMNLGIIIDGVTIKHSSPLGQINGHACYYESPIFDDKEHSIIIEHFGTDEGYISFDIVDIADNGIIKRYNPHILKKYLIKQNNQYYTIKSEFYKNGNYKSIAELEGKEILTEHDFETYGIDDLNLLTKTMDTQDVKGTDKGSLGNGKYFEIILNNFIKTINSQLIYKYKRPSYTDAIYYWVKSDYYGGGTMPINNEVQKLFDGDINTSITTTIHGAHFGIKFNHPTCIRKIEINIGTYDFLSVFSSNDGIEWNNIVQYTKEKSIILDDYGNYLYYRFFVKRSNDYTTVREITLYELIKNYYLIQYNSQIYTFNGTNIILSPSQVLDENNFTNNGFIDVAEIKEEQWNTNFPYKSNVKLLMWTDDMNKTDISLETRINSFRPIDKLKKNSDIGNILFKEV